jgi:hypothetical protein
LRRLRRRGKNFLRGWRLVLEGQYSGWNVTGFGELFLVS